MIYFFIFFILLGIGLFSVVFFKELKGGAFSANADDEALTLRDAAPAFSPMKETKSVQGESSPTGGILAERIVKLEQLLEEKNKQIQQIQQDLAGELSHRGEFESLKDILQRQIEDLKAQNKRLKEDVAARPETSTVNLPPVVLPKEDLIVNTFSGNAGTALSLHDIFDTDNSPTA